MVGILRIGEKNISDLSREMTLDRATVAYHLGILEYAGIVTSEYQMLKAPASKGRIGRYYKLNVDMLNKALEAFHRLYPDDPMRQQLA